MRGMARATSASVMSKGSSMRLAQLPIVEAKQCTEMPASRSVPATSSKAASGMSCRLPFAWPGTVTLRISTWRQPSSRVARTCAANEFPASSEIPHKIMGRRYRRAPRVGRPVSLTGTTTAAPSRDRGGKGGRGH